ncbi:hypothetical protein [Methylobacterium terrae]|uniref:hypothetical protein n=1 Tax=Methylobacterium terrae TaxID=2202827 RepID=UPI0013A589C8|nr:hypothetical protein [Methylobacterium terrae]
MHPSNDEQGTTMPPLVKQLGATVQPNEPIIKVIMPSTGKPVTWQLNRETAKAIESVERSSRNAERLAIKLYGR